MWFCFVRHRTLLWIPGNSYRPFRVRRGLEMKLMQLIIVAAGIVIASGWQAYAEERPASSGETCTSIESTCIATCVAPRPNETCQQECHRYSNTCVRTGTWQGRRWTISGAVRR
jgi:hypothetical protein